MTEVNIGSVYTMLDLLKNQSADAGLITMADVLSRKNPIVREFPMMEANQALSHVGSRNSSLPTVQKRAINDGVPKSTHKEVPVTAPMSLFETMSQVDEELIRLAGSNAEQFRIRKDASFAEAMAQALADEIFYGSLGDDVLGFNGLAVLFNSLSTYPNGDSGWWYNVLSGGASGGTSIYVMEPGPDKVHLIYPKGTTGGLERIDLGKQLVSGVTSSTQYVAYVTQMKWRCGLFVGDDRCVQRIANIAVTGTSNLFDDDQLITALNHLPSMGDDPATRIYVNRVVRTQMDIRAKDKLNIWYNPGTDAFGKATLSFRGVPVVVCDGIGSAEGTVS